MIQTWLDDLLHLVYPKLCAACGRTLYRNENILCSHCLIHLPKTFYHKDHANPLFHLFWGKIPIEMITAFYFYNKGNKVQNLIHQLKYNNRPDIGIYLGKRYGQYLKNDELLKTIDLIIPVPLHQNKLKKRGYNQAEKFADGLAESMNVKVDTSSFIRKVETETQTRKSKQERWENVKNKFEVIAAENIKGNHILLVDDVITTGSTMEACAQVLLSIEGVKISMAGIAAAHH